MPDSQQFNLLAFNLDIGKALTKSKEIYNRYLGHPGAAMVGAGAFLGSLTADNPIKGGLTGATGAALGAVAGKTAWDFANNSTALKPYINLALDWLNTNIGYNLGDYLPYAALGLGALGGYSLLKSGSELHLQKEAGIKMPKGISDIFIRYAVPAGKPITHVLAGLEGLALADAGIYHDANDTYTGWLRALPWAGVVNAANSGDATRMASAGLAASLAGGATFGGRVLSKARWNKAPIATEYATAIGAPVVIDPMVESAFLSARSEKERTDVTRDVAKSEIAKNEADKLRAEEQATTAKSQANAANEAAAASKRNSITNIAGAAGAGALGLAALGLGGYGLYRWLKAREEDRTKMKMKLKGKEGDPYTDATIELPIATPELSDKLTADFNRGVRRAVSRNARLNALKRDPETGKLISYNDYVKKYGTDLEAAPQEKAANVLPNLNLITLSTPAIVNAGNPLLKEETSLSINDTTFTPGSINTHTWSNVPQTVHPAKLTSLFNKLADSKRDAEASQLGEVRGNLIAPTLAGSGVALAAKYLAGLDTKSALLAGMGTASLSPLLGMAGAAFTQSRTESEQKKHDANDWGVANALIPGLATFNLILRARAWKTAPQDQSLAPALPLLNAPDSDEDVDSARPKHTKLPLSDLDDEDDF